MCLDGSPGAYYINKGTGEGSTKWIVYLLGGAWCFFPTFLGKDDKRKMGCYERSQTGMGDHSVTIGTSNGLPPTMQFNQHGNILSDDPAKNPYFYNWNRVFVIYCDGFSFAGNRQVHF